MASFPTTLASPLRTFLARVAVLLAALPTNLLAQTPASVDLLVNRTELQTGQLLKVSLVFTNCEIKELEPPTLEGFQFRGGPSTSTSKQWINGVRTSELRYTYDYIARQEGDLVIPAMTWATNRGQLRSQPVKLRVTQGASPQAPPASSAKGTAVTRDLMTAIEPSKRAVYLGEPLVIAYKIYNRYNGLDVREFDIPELEGFWKETIQDPEARWEPELINGKRYNVATVRRIVAFPQQTGTFVMKDFSLKGFMRVNFFEGKNLTATCEPVTIEVMPLPEAAPANSHGTFNRLSVSQTLSTDSVGANEAVTLEVTYRGVGNLKFLQEPQIAWPAEFEVFDAEVSDQITISDEGERGARTFKFVAIPRAPGDYMLPALQAAFFDPLRGTHTPLYSPALALRVGRDTQQGSSVGMTFSHRQDVQVLNQDIRHIALDPSPFHPRNTVPWMAGLVLGGFALGPLGFAGAAWRRRQRHLETLDRSGTRRKRALRTLADRLSPTSELTLDHVGEAMEGYLMDKLGWERSELTRERAMEALQRHVPQQAEAWKALWAACEMARFGGSGSDAARLARELQELAKLTENAWS